MFQKIFRFRENVIKVWVFIKNQVIKILKINFQISKNQKNNYQQVLII